MIPITARSRVRLAALIVVLLLPSIATAQVPQFDCLYVFGDSLADNGNIFAQTTAMRLEPPVPPSATPHRMYFDGNFSNGYVGVEYLWQRLSGHRPGSVDGLKPFLASPFTETGCAINFAFGGTGTLLVDKTPGGFFSPGLSGQIALFRLALRAGKPSPRSLYVIATGSNDYRNDPTNVPMEPADVVRNIQSAIETLYQIGARTVLVVDLPDFGKIPAYSGDPVTASAVSTLHNNLFDEMVESVQARYPKLHLIPVKLDPLFVQLAGGGMNIQVPLVEVFTQTPGMSGCLAAPATCTDMPPFVFNADFGFLFWDVVHPTTETHRHFGEYMFQQLAREYD